MRDPEAVVRSFYEAFARRDAEAMVACYADDVRFSDPVFPSLEGAAARAMWRMLCERGRDLAIEFEVAPGGASAHWEARYTFGATGRRVHNVIDARFEFRNGAIARHTDAFDLWRWTRHALGPTGVLLGWTPIVRGKVRGMAAKGLAEWRAKHPEA